MVPAIERERERVELLRVHALQCVFELQVEVINVEEERMWIEKRGGRRRREEVEGEEEVDAPKHRLWGAPKPWRKTGKAHLYKCTTLRRTWTVQTVLVHCLPVNQIGTLKTYRADIAG